jgi:hypothetical protein
MVAGDYAMCGLDSLAAEAAFYEAAAQARGVSAVPIVRKAWNANASRKKGLVPQRPEVARLM